MNKKDTREIFDILNREKAEQDAFEDRISSAADRAAKSVDFETIRMYQKAGIPLTQRLKRIDKIRSLATA